MDNLRHKSATSPAAVFPPEPVFKTQSLYLAAWIVATSGLAYLRTENLGRNCVFVFSDAEGKGSALQREFLAGNPMVAVKNLREALGLLRSDLHSIGGDGREKA